MGYRSDVVYVVKFKSFQDRDAYVSLQLAKNNEHITEALHECDYEYRTEPLLTYTADDTKWYDTYTSVQAHTLIYKQAEELFNASWRFVEVGEDGQETVQDGGDDNLFDYVDTTHSIRTDFPD